MSAELTVVIGSLNGAEGVGRCLTALRAQTIAAQIEVVVVDDGSADATSDVARAHGAVVVRHPVRRGISAARNSGISVAHGRVVAFLDDDCEPDPTWAANLIAGYGDDVVGIGGAVIPWPQTGLILRYLTRHNPIVPQELDLARSTGIGYRFRLYLRRQWGRSERRGRRAVTSVPAANMSVRRSALLAVGGFDERIRFGSEDEDLCRRLASEYPGMSLLFEPDARAFHYFKPSLRDVMRRRRAYGHGSAVIYYKWPGAGPTVFPFPVVILAVCISACWFPPLFAAALIAPQLLYPQGMRATLTQRGASCLLDPYLQALEEACDNFGFVEGLVLFRKLRHRPAARRAGRSTDGPLDRLGAPGHDARAE